MGAGLPAQRVSGYVFVKPGGQDILQEIGGFSFSTDVFHPTSETVACASKAKHPEGQWHPKMTSHDDMMHCNDYLDPKEPAFLALLIMISLCKSLKPSVFKCQSHHRDLGHAACVDKQD